MIKKRISTLLLLTMVSTSVVEAYKPIQAKAIDINMENNNNLNIISSSKDYGDYSLEYIECKDSEEYKNKEYSKYYKYNDSDYIITGFNAKKDGDIEVNIPKEIDGHEVVGIGEKAFCKNQQIAKLDLSNVKLIGMYAFQGCENLKEVTNVSELRLIGANSFSNCVNLKYIEIPALLQELQYSAFNGCYRAEKIDINSQYIEQIPTNCFSSCYSVSEINFSKNTKIKKIGSYSFTSCGVGNQYFKNKEGVEDLEAKEVKINIPNTVEEICYNSFNNCNIYNINIPASVKSIGNNAFANSINLKTITFEEGKLNEMEWGVFSGCESLTTVTLPASLKTIHGGLFNNCKSLKSVYMDKCDKLNIERYCGSYDILYGCDSLEEISIPKSFDFSLFQIGVSSKDILNVIMNEPDGTIFSNYNGNYSVVLNEGIDNIPKEAFMDLTGLKSIILPSSLKIISSNAFKNCKNLYQIGFNNDKCNVNYIDSSAFSGCNKRYLSTNLIKFGNYDLTKYMEDSYSYNYDESDCQVKDGFKYIISGSNAVIVGYEGNEKEINIPLTIADKPVIAINDNAFKENKTITSVNFEYCKNLERIGSSAFEGCEYLRKVNIPDKANITSIGDSAFKNCPYLQQVTLNNSLTTLGDSVFNGCSLIKNIVIPSSIQSMYHSLDGASIETVEFNKDTNKIPDGAFYNCKNIKKIIVPSTVTEIGNAAFYNTSGIEKITFGEQNSELKKLVLPSNITTIGESAFQNSELAEIVFSDDTKISQIGKYAFANTSIDKVKMPNEIEELPDNIFSNCTNLSEITNLEHVKIVGKEAFANCSKLKKIVLNKVETIGDNAFVNCTELENIGDLSNVKYIGNKALDNTKLKIRSNGEFLYEVDKNVKIDDKEYSGIILKRYIGNKTAVNIPTEIESYGKVVAIADGMFANSEISTISLENVKYIGKGAFEKCKYLSKINLNNVEYIGEKAFANCESLTEINMPASVYKIESQSFNGTNIKNVKITSSKVQLKNDSFNSDTTIECEGLKYTINSNGITIIGVTEDKIGDDGALNIPSTLNGQPVVSIAKEAFKDNTKIKKVVINSENINIGEEAFRGCTELASIEIKGKVNGIGDRVFYSCNKIGDTIKLSRSSIDGKVAKSVFDGSSITKIQIGDDYVYSFASEGTIKLVSYIGGDATPTIPETINQNKLTTIGAGAFKDNAKITKVSLLNNIETIEDNAFLNCTGLKGIIAPQVKYVGFNILGQTACETSSDNNSGLKYINIGNGAIVTGFIDGNDKRTKLEIPSKLGEAKVISINYRAFAGNTNLKELVLPSSIVSISDEAFDGCVNLVGTIPSTIKVGANAFRNNIERKTSGDYSYYVIGDTIEIVKYSGKDTTIKEIKIPEEIEGKKVTKIAANAFLGYSNLEVVTNFNKGVKTNIKDVENDAFLGTALINKIYNNYIYNPTTGTIIGYIGTNSEIIIPTELNGSKIYVIGEGAFKDNANLTKVTISSGITTIGSKAFSNCQNLKTVEKPSTVTSEAKDAYEGSTNIKNTSQGSETEQKPQDDKTQDDKPQDQKPQETGDNTKLPIVAAILSLVGFVVSKKRR